MILILKMDGGISLKVEIKNPAYVGIAVGDLHCGAFEADIWFHEIEKSLLEPAENMPVLDFIILCGDTLNNKISFNSSHAKYLALFLNRLVKICSKKNSKLRIIKGTESHDNNQLEIIEALLTNADCDVKIIQNVESEWLFEDYHVLYIPEEYIEDKNEYYKDYFSKQYDSIFGHGLIQEALHMAATQESEMTMPKAPVFKVDELIEICKGPIFFGHIHKKIVIKNRFFYTNSFSRWAFGEEEDKGYYLFCYSPITSEFKTEFIVNKTARKFETMEVDCNPDNSIEDQIDYLVKLVDNLADNRDYLRLEVNIPENHPNPSLLTSMLNSVFSKYKKFKLKINNNGKVVKNKEMERKINILLERYGFIFDKKIPVEEKISRYIKEKYQKNISIEKMREYLFDRYLSGE